MEWRLQEYLAVSVNSVQQQENITNDYNSVGQFCTPMIILDWTITEVEGQLQLQWSEWIKEFGSRVNMRMAFGLHFPTA